MYRILEGTCEKKNTTTKLPKQTYNANHTADHRTPLRSVRLVWPTNLVPELWGAHEKLKKLRTEMSLKIAAKLECD